MPRVSVIVPNYNHARHLERRIQSVLDQTFQDFELLLLDDASTDGSQEILHRYVHDPRVVIVINETNTGSPFAQWNRGITLASAPYVWIAEADDDSSPEFLQTMVARLDAMPAAVLAYCQSEEMDENGTLRGPMTHWTDSIDPQRWLRDFDNDGRDECAHSLVLKNSIPNVSAVVFRRDACIAAGMAPLNLRTTGDLLMYARILQHGRIIYVAQPMNLFRKHRQSHCARLPQTVLCEEAYTAALTISEEFNLDRAIRKQAAEEAFQRVWQEVRYATPSPSWKWLRRCADQHAKLGGSRLEFYFRCLLGQVLRTPAGTVLRGVRDALNPRHAHVH